MANLPRFIGHPVGLILLVAQFAHALLASAQQPAPRKCLLNPQPSAAETIAAAWSADETTIAFATRSEVMSYSASDGSLIARVAITPNSLSRFHAPLLRLTPKGDRAALLLRGSPSDLYIADFASKSMTRHDSQAIDAIAFRDTGKILTLAGIPSIRAKHIPGDGTTNIFDLKSVGNKCALAARCEILAYLKDSRTIVVVDPTQHTKLEIAETNGSISEDYVTLSDDGTRCAMLVDLRTSRRGFIVRVFSTLSGKLLTSVEIRGMLPRRYILSADGRFLLVCSAGDSWTMYDVCLEQPLRIEALRRISRYCELSPANRCLLTNWDGEFQIVAIEDIDVIPPALRNTSASGLWSKLQDTDSASEAQQITRVLASRYDEGRPIIFSSLRASVMPTENEITNLIDKLDSEDFAVRQAATALLESFGECILPALDDRLTRRTTPEQSARLKRLRTDCREGRLPRAWYHAIHLVEACQRTEDLKRLRDSLRKDCQLAIRSEIDAAIRRLDLGQ